MHSKHKLLNALFRIISLAVVTAWLMALAITSAYAQCPGQIGVNDIYDYTPQDGGYSTNLALDTYGNIYGAIGGGGSYGQGWLYKLSDRGGHWLLDPLYNFVGDSNGFGPGNVLLGPQNALYGVADGGIQCNDGYYCGLVYKVSPGPTVCTPALCSWNESTLYQFTWGVYATYGVFASVSTFDPAGNLYGISQVGGASGNGAIFELSPSQGGWTETTLYSFTGYNDGSWPSSLLMGPDGNLYGTALEGGAAWGTVFQLVPSNGGWTFNVLHTFNGTTDGYSPGNLVRDERGNLYGASTCENYTYCGGLESCNYGGGGQYGLVFELSGGDFHVIYNNAQDSGDFCYNSIGALALDAAGNLYATEGGYNYAGSPSWGAVIEVTPPTHLVTVGSDIFSDLTSSASGTLYGTTAVCGKYGNGMVWQYVP